MRIPFYSVLICVIALFLSVSTLVSQTNFWKATNGPPGGRVNSILVDSNFDIYISTAVGFFRSIDHAQTWVQVVVPSPDGEVYAVATAKTGAWYAATDNYVYRSTDKGSTWSQIINGFPGSIISSIAIATDGDIFAGCSNDAAVYRSSDNGVSWILCNNGLGGWVRALAIGPTGTIIAGTDAGIFRSTNRGESWTQSDSSLTILNVRSIVVMPDGELFAGSAGVFRSTDDGKDWISCLKSTGICTLSADPNGFLCAGTLGGTVERSTDDGNSWVGISGNFLSQPITSIAIESGGLILLGTLNDGLYGTTDLGAHWTPAGASSAFDYAFGVDSQGDIYAGTSNGIFYSTDQGNSWSLFALHGMSVPEFCLSASGSIFAPFPDSSLRRSTDRGVNWSPLSLGAFSLNSLIADPDGDLFAAESKGGVFRSTDDGATWMNVFSQYPESVGPVARSPGGVLYFTWGSVIYRSVDHGVTWHEVLEADKAFPCNCAIGADAKGNVYAAIDGGGVFFSSDSGGHWDKENSGLNHGNINGFGFNAGGRVFAASDSGVFFRDEGNQVWNSLNNGLTIQRTKCLAVDSAGYLYTGTMGAGVFRSIVPVVVSVSGPAPVVPSVNRLDQNYPNPFNPSTRIPYSLAGKGYIEIDVYNALGQLVRNLVREWKNQGRYFVDFNAAGLASGVYLCRIRFSGKNTSFTEAKSIVLLK